MSADIPEGLIMDHITIPIPDGIDPEQKAALTQWLTMQAEEFLPRRLPCEDDPHWQAEVTEKIKRGMADFEAGRVMTSAQALARLDEKLRQAGAK